MFDLFTNVQNETKGVVGLRIAYVLGSGTFVLIDEWCKPIAEARTLAGLLGEDVTPIVRAYAEKLVKEEAEREGKRKAAGVSP